MKPNKVVLHADCLGTWVGAFLEPLVQSTMKLRYASAASPQCTDLLNGWVLSPHLSGGSEVAKAASRGRTAEVQASLLPSCRYTLGRRVSLEAEADAEATSNRRPTSGLLLSGEVRLNRASLLLVASRSCSQLACLPARKKGRSQYESLMCVSSSVLECLSENKHCPFFFFCFVARECVDYRPSKRDREPGPSWN